MSTSSFLSLLLPLLTTNFGNVQSFAPVLGRGKASGGRSVSFQRDPPVLLRTGTLDNILVTESTNPDSTNTKEEFNWFKAWYPLVPVEILDREQPHRFQLLGEDIVVWNDGPVEGHGKFVSKKKRPRGAQRSEGTWRAFVDRFLENVVDPAHVTVSHHNVVGSRYSDQGLKLEAGKPLTKGGFSIISNSPGSLQPSTTEFCAPSLVAIDAPAGDGEGMQTLELYVSPSRPGFCNHIGRMVIRKGKDGKMPALLRQFTLPLPKWTNHILASAFLNQDALFLHHQERTLAATGQYKSVLEDGEERFNYNNAVYPVNSDKGVITFRNWLRQFAGGRIPYKNRPVMPAASNDAVFDVWNAHTKYCQFCQASLRRLKKFRLASFLVATILGVMRPFGKAGSLAGTLAFAGTGLVLHKLIGMFYRYEFSHAHND